jgi:hypothetical protein
MMVGLIGIPAVVEINRVSAEIIRIIIVLEAPVLIG